MIFIRKANLVPWYLLFLLILRHWEARRVPRRHSISSKTWCHGLSLISNNPHTRCKHLCIIFSASAPSGPNLFSITGIKVMTSGIAFDRPDRLSRLRAFLYDRYKIYTIVPIVRIELNSIQAIKVVSVVWVVCDCLGSVSIWSSLFETTGTIRTIRTIIWKPGLTVLTYSDNKSIILSTVPSLNFVSSTRDSEKKTFWLNLNLFARKIFVEIMNKENPSLAFYRELSFPY